MNLILGDWNFLLNHEFSNYMGFHYIFWFGLNVYAKGNLIIIIIIIQYNK